MVDLLANGEEEVRAAFTLIVEHLRQENTLDALERAILEGRTHDVIAQLDEAAQHLAETLTRVYTTAALEASQDLGQMAGKLVTFNTSDPYAVQAIARSRLETIQAFTEEQRALVRQVVGDGLRAGQNPREMARALRGSIGLTPAQQEYVANYRRQLESGEWDAAMARELHDGRYDRAIRTAQRDGRPLGRDQIDRMVERYEDNWIAHRAETISRTEALRSVHEGVDEAYRQAIERGDVALEDLENTWHSGHPPRTRDWHAVMNNQTQPYGQPFVSGHGVLLMYPGDESAPADEVCNCQCCRSTTLRVGARAAA